MNQQDTTMMIAAQIVAALAAQTGEDVFDDRRNEDYRPNENGTFYMCQHGYPLYANKDHGFDPEKHERIALINTREDRIARYAAELADKTVHAVQRKLNETNPPQGTTPIK